MQRQYWSFYWPLALTGLVLLLGTQFQNGVLARYPRAERELAVFAFASSTFGLCNSLLVFVPQMSNVLARSHHDHRICLSFTAGACLLLTAPLVVLAFGPSGRAGLGWAFGIEGDSLDDVVRYLRYLTPLVLVNGLRGYYTGMLVQARRTGTVTVLNVVQLAVVIAALLTGLALGWSPVATLAASLVCSATLHLALTCLCHRLRYRLPEPNGQADLTFREVLAFFWPVAATSAMFALSRPVLYAFVNRTTASVATVAALRVSFGFAMIFHSPVNQFRHLFVVFGQADPAGTRRFMGVVMLVLTAAMVVVVATPLSTLILHDLMNVREPVLHMARQVLMVLCLTPLVITIRNYFHGHLLVRRRTGGMAAGGVTRVAVICAAAWLCQTAGHLNHAVVAAVLLLGFAAEAAVAAFYTRQGAALQTAAEML